MQLCVGAYEALTAEGVPAKDQTTTYEVDVRYHGQGLVMTIDADAKTFAKGGLAALGKHFDAMHEQMFTFALDHDQELVNLRAIVQGKPTSVRAEKVAKGRSDASAAVVETTTIYAGGKKMKAKIYNRAKLKAGNKIAGPAVVMEMDSTTLILPGHYGEVDAVGTILIWPGR